MHKLVDTILNLAELGPAQLKLVLFFCLKKVRESFQKNYLVREIVPIPSDIPSIQTISEYLDSEYWLNFYPPTY